VLEAIQAVQSRRRLPDGDHVPRAGAWEHHRAANAGGEKGKAVEHTAAEIVRHYERTNRAVGRARDAVVRLLRIREAMSVKADGRVTSR